MEIEKAKRALLAMQRHSWEQGVAMQALWETGDRETAIAMAIEAAYRAMPDGRVASIGVTNGVTDPCSAGEVLLRAADITDMPLLREAARKLLRWALADAPRNGAGIVYHLDDGKQFWVDSLYMLPPFLAAAGEYAEAVRQIDGYWAALFDAGKGLLRHMWDDEKHAYARDAFWGVGNGWAMAGLCRVIDLLPDTMAAEKNRLIAMNRALIQTVARYIREDGLAHDVLDDDGAFPEANLPQMFAYAVYRGIKSGWLDAALEPLADKCRRAACAQMDAHGFIWGVCGAPTFDKPGVAPEGQAFFLLMYAAYTKLMQERGGSHQ